MLMFYLLCSLDNLSNYDETYIRNYTDGFYITLTRIGKLVFCYGSFIGKPNHTYTSVIPENFRPKGDVQVIWSRFDAATLSPISLTIDSNGVIKTTANYNNQIASGITIWEAR